MLEEFFGEEPVYIPVSSAAGGIDAAIHPILVALWKAGTDDISPTPQPKTEALEELVLELTDLKFQEQDGVRRASARARLVYEPATPGQREVKSAQSWRFIAPLGPIEAEELRWYLEKFALWPSEYFRDRARRVEESLVKWGELLHAAAIPSAHTANVMNAWMRIDGHAGRRFSVHVDSALEAGAPDTDVGPPAKPPRSCSVYPGNFCTTATASSSRAENPCASVGVCRIRACSTCRWSPRRSAFC